MQKNPDNWINVKSSNMQAVRHDAEKKLLFVRFLPRKEELLCRIYRYENVESQTFTNLVNAKSKGKFFNQFIKKHCPCQRDVALEPVEQPDPKTLHGGDDGKRTENKV